MSGQPHVNRASAQDARTLFAIIEAIPMRAKVVAVSLAAVVALLVAGVPAAALASFAGPAACLGMMLFMGHGAHGGGHDHLDGDAHR